jgi:hypothetical protein
MPGYMYFGALVLAMTQVSVFSQSERTTASDFGGNITLQSGSRKLQITSSGMKHNPVLSEQQDRLVFTALGRGGGLYMANRNDGWRPKLLFGIPFSVDSREYREAVDYRFSVVSNSLLVLTNFSATAFTLLRVDLSTGIPSVINAAVTAFHEVLSGEFKGDLVLKRRDWGRPDPNMPERIIFVYELTSPLGTSLRKIGSLERVDGLLGYRPEFCPSDTK